HIGSPTKTSVAATSASVSLMPVSLSITAVHVDKEYVTTAPLIAGPCPPGVGTILCG
ncbi:hypothetical protein M9458_040384, partial [Cirrhinus mrigala]